MTDLDTIITRYDRASDAFARTVRAVPAGAWENQTPCREWSARELVNHVAKNAGVFLRLVGEPVPELPPVAVDPAASWAVGDAAIRAALGTPDVATKEFEGYFGRTTFARAVDSFVSFDLVVHRWDLAHATGLDERLAPEEIAHIRAAAEGFGPSLRFPNVCGPALDTAPGADDQAVLLAFLGRRA